MAKPKMPNLQWGRAKNRVVTFIRTIRAKWGHWKRKSLGPGGKERTPSRNTLQTEARKTKAKSQITSIHNLKEGQEPDPCDRRCAVRIENRRASPARGGKRNRNWTKRKLKGTRSPHREGSMGGEKCGICHQICQRGAEPTRHEQNLEKGEMKRTLIEGSRLGGQLNSNRHKILILL